MFGQLNEFENWCFRTCHWPHTRQQECTGTGLTQGELALRTYKALPEALSTETWAGQEARVMWAAWGNCWPMVCMLLCGGRSCWNFTSEGPKGCKPNPPPTPPLGTRWEPRRKEIGRGLWGYRAGRDNSLHLKNPETWVPRAKVSTSAGHSASRQSMRVPLPETWGRQPSPASEILDWKT